MSLIGFVRYSWFFSIGYGLSMSVMALLCMAHFSAAGTVSMIALLHSSLVLAWGVRLATFLAYREFVAWPDAKKRNAEVTKKMSLSSKAATWAGVTLFDALLFSPVLFVFKTPTKLLSVAYAGIAMQVAEVSSHVYRLPLAGGSAWRESVTCIKVTTAASVQARSCGNASDFASTWTGGGAVAGGCGRPAEVGASQKDQHACQRRPLRLFAAPELPR